jgi:ferredoxin
MKVVVDFEVCQSHGLCTQSAPEVFELRDDGFLYILQESPPEQLRKQVEAAARECPTGAIEIQG